MDEDMKERINDTLPPVSCKKQIRHMTMEERRAYDAHRKRQQRAKKHPVTLTTADSTTCKVVDEKPPNHKDDDTGIKEGQLVRKVIGLRNGGENVCFANSVVQLMYRLPDFRHLVEETTLSGCCVTSLKKLFRRMTSCRASFKSSSYFEAMNIPNYIKGQQYDSHEFLTYLLDMLYPNLGNDPCMFKFGTISSITCTHCSHTAASRQDNSILTVNVDSGSHQQSISRLLQAYCSAELLSGYVCDSCRQLNYCYKTVVLESCPAVLVIQLSIFSGLGSKLMPSLLIDPEITVDGVPLEIYGLIYHDGRTVQSGHYTASVRVGATWYHVDDSTVTQLPPHLRCSLNEEKVPYIVIYKRRMNVDVAVVVPSPSEASRQFKGKVENVDCYATTGNTINSGDIDFTIECVNTVHMDTDATSLARHRGKLRQEKKRMVETAKQKEERSTKAKSRLQTSRMAETAEQKEERSKKEKYRLQSKRMAETAEQKEERSNKEKSRLQTKRKAETAEQKEAGTKKAKAGMQQKRMAETVEQQEERSNKEKSRLQQNRLSNKQKELQLFAPTSGMSMTDFSILDTASFKLVEARFVSAISKGPTFICQCCLKFEYRVNVVCAVRAKYDTTLYDRCNTNHSGFICKLCHHALLKNKMPVQAQANGLALNTIIQQVTMLCPLEHLLVSQVIPFMFIIARHKGAQSGLKGQVVLVPTDLQKIQSVLPRSTSDDHIIALALKRRLTDKSSFSQQYIRPAAVNRALLILKEINPFYKEVVISDTWQTISAQSDPEMWQMLTGGNNNNNPAVDTNDGSSSGDEGDDDVDHSTGILPTVMHTTHEPEIAANEMVEIAPAQGQIPVSFFCEPNWEALAYPRHFPQGKNHFNEDRECKISPIKYVNARMKCSDGRFAADPQYTFQCLEWVEKTVIASHISIAERKHKDVCRNVRQVNDKSKIQRLLSDDEVFATFKTLRGSPQYFHHMALDVLAKIRMFGPPTFFITFSAAEFYWADIIKIVAQQFQETLSDNDINNMDWKTKVNYLKRNPVTVARQIDYRFNQLWGKVLLSGMHPIGEILNYDVRDEFQMRGVQHIHAVIHVKDAPKIDVDSDDAVVDFIDKYITCTLPPQNDRPQLFHLVNTRQRHRCSPTCRKKAGIKCRFYYPCPPTRKTVIVRPPLLATKQEVKHAERTMADVLQKMAAVANLSDVTEDDILSAALVSRGDYDKSFSFLRKKTTVFYKRKPCDTSISPYNTVILQIWQANMNIQYVTGIHGVIAYLTSYLCKAESGMSELMKKATKEAGGGEVREQLKAIGHVFRKHREVSQHEAIARILSFSYRHSNIPVRFIPTGPKKNRTRILKPQSVLDKMDPDDDDVYALSMLDRYSKRPDQLEGMCLADFASNYEYTSAKSEDDENLQRYYTEVYDYNTDLNVCAGTVIKLKDGVGSMKKRSKPCVIRWHCVSKLKNSEEYFLRLLQLYLPWREEEKLLHVDGTYESMFNEAKDGIDIKVKEYEEYEDLEYDDLQAGYVSSSDDDSDIVDDNVVPAANPALLECDVLPGDPIPQNPNTAARIRDFLLPNNVFYEMCTQLNEQQRSFLQCVLIHANKMRWLTNAERPPPLSVFLSGGGGVGKSFLITTIAQCLKRLLKHSGQLLDQPSILITASTGKAAVGISGVTLHSAFFLPIKGSGWSTKLGAETLQSMRFKYKYLQYLVVDEISMVGYSTFEDLNRHLKLIKENESYFGGVSIIACGDFFQLPPVKQVFIFSRPKVTGYEVLAAHLWKDLFQLHELTEIVRQAGDPLFASLLSRVREGKQTAADMTEITALNDTDTSTWPKGSCINIYLTNHLAGVENTKALNKLPSRKEVISAMDSRRDNETGTCNVTVPADWPLAKTGNLCKQLTVAVGCRLMLTVNLDTEDHLINGSLGTVVHLQFGSRLLSGIIYIRFDDEAAGNSKKNKKLPPHLRTCVPVTAYTTTFTMSHQHKSITVQRKQFPFIVGHAITSHKSQGSTYQYMIASLHRICKTGTRKLKVLPGQFYTMLSRGKCRSGIKLLHFEPDVIVTNKFAQIEMTRMRDKCVFFCQQEISQCSFLLWNVSNSGVNHISHLLSDPKYVQFCDLMCFTEAKVNGIEIFDDTWDILQNDSEHGLALCYKKAHVTVLEAFPVDKQLEAMAVLLQHHTAHILLVLLYRKPGAVHTFIQTLNQQLHLFTNRLPVGCRIMVIGDFNLDQHDEKKVLLFDAIQEEHNLVQRSRFTTHMHGGILDLWFDTNCASQSVTWIPTPYSDHFVLLSS